MQRLLFTVNFLPIWLLIWSTLAVSALSAQTHDAQVQHVQAPLSPIRAVDPNQLRTEQAISRQRTAIDAMAESVARQQRSVGRQRGASLMGDFFDHPSERTLTLITPPPCDSLPRSRIDTLVNSASERTSVPAELIRSVMQQESAFRACAVSTKGAMGLMQLEPSTALDLGVKDAFDPEANVLGGARLLKQLMDRYGGDLKLTLSAYNAGSGKVDAAEGIPKIPETRDYVSRILALMSPGNLLLPTIETDSPAEGQADSDNPTDINFLLMSNDGGK